MVWVSHQGSRMAHAAVFEGSYTYGSSFGIDNALHSAHGFSKKYKNREKNPLADSAGDLCSGPDRDAFPRGVIVVDSRWWLVYRHCIAEPVSIFDRFIRSEERRVGKECV